MADTLSVLRYYLYYKYKKRFPDRSALERWQVHRTKKHLEYVREHSRLHKGMKELSSYPVIDKEFMMEHFDELDTVGVGREGALEFIVLVERQRNFSPKLKGVTAGPSSGTPGKQGIFLVSDDKKDRWAGHILMRLLPRSLFETYSIAFFMGADSNLYQTVKSRNIQLHSFDIYKDMEEHRKRLGEIRSWMLAGQSSLLPMIAENVRKGKTNTCPRIVISIVEVLEQADEQRIKEAFSLSVIHQVYQCTEGCLATTCSMGTLCLNEDMVYIGWEYLDGRWFVPMVTDLERKAQPIIRHRLNDILVERREPCGCGSPLLALEKTEGREDDVFSSERKDGRNVSVFPGFIRRCTLFGDKGSDESQAGSSRDYGIAQETDGCLTVYVDTADPGKQRVLKEFELLSKDCGFPLPDISFQSYGCEKGRKMKRVECRGAEPVKGRCI